MKKTKSQNRFRLSVIISFVFVLLVTIGLRLYKIGTPLADFHSWRQADTAAVARNYSKDGINLLKPRYDDLSNIQSGMENPQGFRMVEFPLYNAAISAVETTTHACSIEVCGRLLSVLSAAIITSVLFYLLLKEHGLLAAFTGTLTFAAAPFAVYFTRVVLPEPSAVAAAMLSIFWLYLFSNRNGNGTRATIYFLLSSLSFMTAELIKPTAIFYGVPLAYLFIRTYTWDVMKKPLTYLYWILALTPLFLWRQYILQFPAGIPVSEWLFTSVNTSEGLQNIFFKPSFFRWIFFERINNLILGGYLTVFFVLGAFSRQKKYLSHSILLGSLAFLFVFQGGNVQHEYYQTLILPALAMFVGIGISYIHAHSRQFISSTFLTPIIAGMYIFSLFISYYTVRTYYNYPGDLVQISKIVKDLTNENDLIVTDTLGDTTLLYLSQRRGAPAVYEDLTLLKAKGYRYFVTQKQDVADEIIANKTHTLKFRTDKFVLFEL